MKTFLNTLGEIELEQINGPDGRSYGGKGFKYPSVTTVTSLHTEEGIRAWRAAVGAEAANRISRIASARGTAVHGLCEAYLKTGEAKTVAHAEMFGAIRPHLDLIDNIHCLESKMVSHKLKVAGTVDVIGEYRKKLAVIDFKTSNKLKPFKWVDHYFMQTAAYACMYYEATGTLVDRLVLIIGVDGGECQIFEQKTAPWLIEFKKLRERFANERGR